MNKAEMRAPWEFTKGVLSLAPVASNSAQNGASIDRTGYFALIADVAFSCSGSPTGGTLAVKLQDSADGTTFADFGSPIAVAIPASGGALASLALDIAGARQFVRTVTTGSPTGGTSPVVSAAVTVRLHGPDRLPAL